MLEWRLVAVATLAGLALGSYAVTSGIRLSRASSGSLRSACDHCGVALSFSETVPLYSHLRAGGVCRHCGQPIDRAHMAGEIAGAVVAITSSLIAPPATAGLMIVLGLGLIVSSTVDIKTMRLPNSMTALIAGAAGALAAINSVESLVAGALAAVATACLLAFLQRASKRSGEVSLGTGDIKLAAALALWLGAGTPFMIVAASLLGLAAAPFARDDRGRLPFGPMISLAGWSTGVAMQAGWQPWLT